MLILIKYLIKIHLSSPGGSDGKESAMRETQVQSLSQEDPWEKGMAMHSSIFAWRTPWTRGACQATVHGLKKSQTQHFHSH